MQALTAAPRTGLISDADVIRLVTADDTKVSAVKVELLGLDDQVLADVSADVRLGDAAPVISWDGTRAVHREVDLLIARDLLWDRDRLRLSCRLSSHTLGLHAWFYGGVFVMTTPEAVADDVYLLDADQTGGGTVVRSAKGFDKLYLLTSILFDAFVAATDGTVIDPVRLGGTGTGSTNLGGVLRALLDVAEWRGAVAIDSRLAALTLPEPLVFAADGTVTHLAALTKILAAVGGDVPWCDEAGTLHLDLLTQVSARTVEFVHDAQDAARTIVGRKRTRTADLTQIPNAWRFIASNWGDTPTIENGGMYEPPRNVGVGPTSTTSRGRTKGAIVTLDVSSAAALVAAGDAQRAADLRAAGVRALTLGCFPLHGHRDLFELRDVGLSDPVRAVVTRWQLRYDGASGSVESEEVV